jgi:hypothetical protein
MNPDGSGARLVTTDPSDSEPAWSPDGKRIALSNGGRVELVDSDGSGRTALTHGAGWDTRPTWSPDGKSIAFSSYREGNSDIYAVQIATGVVQRLTSDPAGDYAPAWSPDGTQIAFASDRGGETRIYLMNADGSAQKPLTDGGGYDSLPAWSPDGTRIAFDRNSQVWAIARDGSGAQQLTTGEGSTYPAWQPLGPAPAGCTLWGTSSNDLLVGTEGRDVICGLDGNDTLIGLSGDDIVYGGNGNDSLAGGLGFDQLDGGPSNDHLDAADGDEDRLAGGDGADFAVVDPRIDQRFDVESSRLSRNLAAWRPVTASAFEPTNPPVRAVDGVSGDWWNSGGYPSQWIQVDLQRAKKRRAGSARRARAAEGRSLPRARERPTNARRLQALAHVPRTDRLSPGADLLAEASLAAGSLPADRHAGRERAGRMGLSARSGGLRGEALARQQFVARNVPQDPRRVADDNNSRGHVFRHDRSGADERLLADLDAGTQHSGAPHACSSADGWAFSKLVPALGAAHEVVVRGHDARRDEDLLLERRVGRDVGIRLDLRQRADGGVVLDQRAPTDDDVVADGAALAHAGLVADDHPCSDRGAREDHGAGGDDGARAELRRGQILQLRRRARRQDGLLADDGVLEHLRALAEDGARLDDRGRVDPGSHAPGLLWLSAGEAGLRKRLTPLAAGGRLTWGNLPVPPDPFHRSASRTGGSAAGAWPY